MLNELRTLGGNDLNTIVPARIASMPQDHADTVSLFRWVLQRLEVFGPEAVRLWCLSLVHGRVGMANRRGVRDALQCYQRSKYIKPDLAPKGPGPCVGGGSWFS
jgi:hypothetical protein